MKTSNKFTLVRVIAAPIFFIIYFLPKWASSSEGSLLSLISFCILVPMLIFSELTDYWDGHFARKNNEVSDFGKMFDPFADVFLHLSVFTCMTFSGYMPVICFVLIFTGNSRRIFCAWLRQNRELQLPQGRAENLRLFFMSSAVSSPLPQTVFSGLE